MSKDNETAIAMVDAGAVMESVIAKGDLSKLTSEERARYYAETCRSMGMNPLTKPFDYLTLNGKLTLYATRTATDQLRKINGVSLEVLSEETTADGLRVVRVRASTPDGRRDEEIGAVNVAGLKADALANGYMKAITKAKRRATLSICGLGFLDETEIETMPEARRVPVSSYVPDDEPTIDITEAEYQVDEDGEIVSDDNAGKADGSPSSGIELAPMNQIEEEHYAALLAAKSMAALNAEAARIADGGLTHPSLREAYRTRRDELQAAKDAKQPELVGVAAGEAGNDRHSR